MERATARLLARGDHLGAVSREHASGRAVLRAEGDLLDAARKHAHTRALLALSGRELGQRRALGGGWQRGEERLPLAERRGQQLDEARGAREALEPAHLVEAEPRRGETEHARARQEKREVHPAEEPAERAAGALLLHLGTGGLDKLPVGDARGAHRLAGATAEAEIEVRDGGVAQLEPAFCERLHDEDAAARRVHLGAEDREGGAVGEAEAAVHAAVYALHVVAMEGERAGWPGGQSLGNHGLSLLASLSLTISALTSRSRQAGPLEQRPSPSGGEGCGTPSPSREG